MTPYATSYWRQAVLVCLMALCAFADASSQELNELNQAMPGMQSGTRIDKPAPVDPKFDASAANPANLSNNGAKTQNSIASGNPLWVIPLASLTATRERPIFSPSRRPYPVAGLASAQSSPLPVVEQSNRPPFALVGAIVGEGNDIAILLDETTKGIVRLNTGENYSGWTLQFVRGREATLQRNHQTAILALRNPPAK
jgi:hypothetical protein